MVNEVTVYRFDTPISEAEIRKLKVNDVIYLSGTIVTARDEAHKRALDYFKRGISLPIKLEGLAVFHCGPIAKKKDGEWNIVAAGPTTSVRMEMFEEEFLEHSKVRVVIGKGGMGDKTTEAMKKYGAVYGAFTGGGAVLAAKSIQKVEGVEWLDLGVPEAMWALKVKEFGPLAIAIDSHGNNYFTKIQQKAENNKIQIYRKLGLPL